MLVFEGTLEEIKALQREMMSSGGQALAVALTPHPENLQPGLTPGRQFASADLAFRVLTRRPLSLEQRAVIAAIYNSHPDGILATELQAKIGYSTSQFAGLMGALGRRLVNTQGYVDYTWFVDNQWEAEHGCNRYRFPESVREAIEKADLV
jgi:hypothetical protein